jgi:hypothetical protein
MRRNLTHLDVGFRGQPAQYCTMLIGLCDTAFPFSSWPPLGGPNGNPSAEKHGGQFHWA